MSLVKVKLRRLATQSGLERVLPTIAHLVYLVLNLIA